MQTTQTTDKIINLLHNKRKGLTKTELIKKLGYAKKQREDIESVLDSITDNGIAVRKNGRYILSSTLGFIPATVVKVNKTFGFATPKSADNSEKTSPDIKDFFIPGRDMLGALPGDIVLINPSQGAGDLPEGKIVSIIKQNNAPFAGTVFKDEYGAPVIMPDKYIKYPIKLSYSSADNVAEGSKVIAIVNNRGDRHSKHIADIIKIYGNSGYAEVCAKAILHENDIADIFPQEVIEQAQAISSGGEIHPKEIAARLDLREENIFTIDGSDTKDIDDAVSLTKNADGWILGVHIADVSYYVNAGSPIDEEAYKRGTSVYYANQVIPMLPKELSNGICSLNPGQERLSFSAIVHLNSKGDIVSYEFKKTMIKSRLQGVYSEINTILDNTAPQDILEKYSEQIDVLKDMAELAAVLAQRREKRGGVNLETLESKIIVGEDGTAQDVVLRERGESERIIEEFMLVANEAAANFALTLELPFMFRTHEKPSPDKLAIWIEELQKLGITIRLPRGEAKPGHLAAALVKAQGSKHQKLVNELTLRVMQKAKYTPQNIGHFGLALKEYAHFTSPIRRYPDLSIHRIMSSYIMGMKRENIEKRFRKWSVEASAHSTAREIAAMTAERMCEDCYKAEYMKKHIGEKFLCTISGVTNFGVFVQLANTIEGLVEISELPPDDWKFDGHSAYLGRNGGKISLGDSVEAIAINADVSSGKVDFSIKQAML